MPFRSQAERLWNWKKKNNNLNTSSVILHFYTALSNKHIFLKRIQWIITLHTCPIIINWTHCPGHVRDVLLINHTHINVEHMPIHTYVNNAVIDLVFLDHCIYKQQAGRGTHQTVYYSLPARLFPPNLWYISVPNTWSGFPPNFSSLCDATALAVLPQYYFSVFTLFAILCSHNFAYFKQFLWLRYLVDLFLSKTS